MMIVTREALESEVVEIIQKCDILGYSVASSWCGRKRGRSGLAFFSRAQRRHFCRDR